MVMCGCVWFLQFRVAGGPGRWAKIVLVLWYRIFRLWKEAHGMPDLRGSNCDSRILLFFMYYVQFIHLIWYIRKECQDRQDRQDVLGVFKLPEIVTLFFGWLKNNSNGVFFLWREEDEKREVRIMVSVGIFLLVEPLEGRTGSHLDQSHWRLKGKRLIACQDDFEEHPRVIQIGKKMSGKNICSHEFRSDATTKMCFVCKTMTLPIQTIRYINNSQTLLLLNMKVVSVSRNISESNENETCSKQTNPFHRHKSSTKLFQMFRPVPRRLCTHTTAHDSHFWTQYTS